MLSSGNLAGWRHPTAGWGIQKLVVVARGVVIALHKHMDADPYQAQLDHHLTLARKHLDVSTTTRHNGKLCSKIGSEHWPSYNTDVPPKS
jgi:hypothetical protein